ncbi:hypothetical protein PHMEG_00032313 [Phytophthora megakarya]|uniref:Uncharacterized protein n=1 Tax=Phytophthora megakarya TaxID=4795 RepID=A0A225UWP0_9STRA|nr:hypothetical protein PHMEG_00032313 [Phytophthora megakarya]
MESRRQRAETTPSVMAEQVKVEDQPPASLDTERTQVRVKKDVEEATRRERERFQTEYEQRWRQHMAEVEQERVRWTAEATRTLGAQQEALAAERASLQQLKNTEEHQRYQETSSVTSPIKGDARDCPVYTPVKNLTEVALSQLRATLPEVKDEPRVNSTKAGRRAPSAPKAQTVSDVCESSFRQSKSGDSGSTKSGSGKKSPNRPESSKSSTRKAKEDPGSPPSDPGDDSDSSSDDGDNSDSSSSG